MKSLDALISYLLEEVALCGKQGAGPSEVFKFIAAFYAKSSPNSDNIFEGQVDEGSNTNFIDQKFQKQVWTWLVRHPECRVGTVGQDGKISLSAVEAPNRQEILLQPLISNRDGPHNEFQSSGTREGKNRGSAEIPESFVAATQLQEEINMNKSLSVHEQTDIATSSRSAKLGASQRHVNQSQGTDNEVRVYASEERMWHAMAGHGVDHSKIPPLDFICLSIIAAAGPKGIIQSDVVKISDQDKRSVPHRTQRLFEKGYIIKTPVLIGASRTSVCILKRFVTVAKANKPEADASRKEPDLDIDSQKIFQECFPDGGANLYVLLRHIFDLLNRFKIIALEDLRSRLGVVGHRWERRVLASTLRKLEAVGCAKQVRAQAHSLGSDSQYFRCLKLIREPGANESQHLCGLSNVNLGSVSIDATEISDSESEVNEDDEAQQTLSHAGLDDRVEGTNLRELRRPIPQWTGSGCFGNILYDIIQKAGTRGLSTMDVKDQVLGRFVSRPVENQLTRIVDHWQVSQPPHLRHLAIIRDTAMGKKSTYYVHYTYDNFKKLVENGEASWEAVSIVGADSKDMQQPAFAADSNVEVDEFGFPNIPTVLFQGRHNDATVSQCANAVDVHMAPTSKNDPVVRALSDGIYEVQHAPAWRGKRSLKPVVPKASMPESSIKPSSALRPPGRPRKVTGNVLPTGMTPAQKAKYTKSRQAAVRYQKRKVEKEVARRLGEGEDPDHVRESIFAQVSAQYLDVGEDIPASVKELRVHGMKLSGSPSTGIVSAMEHASAEQQSRDLLSTSNDPAVFEYLPSVSAHTHRVLMNIGTVLNGEGFGAEPVLNRFLKSCIPRGDTEKADLVSKPNGSIDNAYGEQSNSIRREGCGVFVGPDALRARLPGQRGRSRKCRLAIFKSARLSDFEWFRETHHSIGNKASTPVSHGQQLRPQTSSPRFHISAEASRNELPSSAVKSSGSHPADNDCKSTPKPVYALLSTDYHNVQEKGSIGSNVSDSVCPSATTLPETSRGEKKTFTVRSARNVSEAAYDGKPLTSLDLRTNISTFTPINALMKQNLPNTSNKSAESRRTVRSDNTQVVPSKDISRSQALDVINTNPEEQATSPSKPPEIGTASAGIRNGIPRRNSPQVEDEDVAHRRKEKPGTATTAPPHVIDASTVVAGGTGIDESGRFLQANARLANPVTVTGGSVSILRKKIIMDIIQMCGGIYSGHRELLGPFVTAWAKQKKPGKPDNKTIYTAFRSLVQACKLRELKFSFQNPQGLVVTKSMITLTSISPTDPRVVEMQKLMIACYPSSFIPDGVDISEEVRNPPLHPSKYGTNRALADLEIDNESQVQLQHTPNCVTRLERREAALERNRAARKERREAAVERNRAALKEGIETVRANYGAHMDRIISWNSSKLVEPLRRVERSASIRSPFVRSNQESMAMSTIGMRQFGRANAGIDFSYISSEVESGDEDMAGNNEEDFSVLHKRKRDLSDCYETGKNIEDSGSGKRKRRRLTGQYSRMEYSQSSSNALRQISTMMDPDHSVHAPTGTFSVTFSGFKSTSVEAIRPRGTKLLSEVTTDFEKEVDDLLRWELETYDFADSVFPDWPFINYKILHPHLTPAETEYAIGPNFAIKFYQRRKPYASSSTKKVTILEKIPEGETDLQLHKKSHKRKRRDPVLKTRRLTSLSQAHASAGFGTSETSKRGPRPQKLRKVRGPQKQHPMTRDEEERLLAAVVAIRTITGGIDKNPDWVLISRLFQPSFSQMYIQKRWAQVLQRNRLQMDQIQANFQTKFAKAYEENIIPTINFDHLEDYDWEWLVEWTLDNIDTSWDSLQYLPSKRSELDLLFEITASTEVDMSEYFEINSSVTLQRREAVLNKSPYVYPTDHSRQPTANARSQEVAIAKTWIRANVITAAASYNSDLARAKLSAISESSVDLALQELLSARLLSQSNKGRLVPGRNYDISDYFLSRFRKKFDTAQFRRAVSFKRRLDDKFDEESSVLIPYEASNGDILATLNMLAFGRITVRAKNPPMKKFGLTDGGYRTRLMDKSRLNFDVEIHRTATYITGNPISPLPSPPCQHLNDPMAKIPLWYDIHGEFVLVMWDMLLAATMSILNMRLSVTAAEIAHSLRPSTETWEIELLLEWMVRAGAATKTEEGGYTMTEWWWMCLDNNNEELVISPGGNAGAK